MNKLKHFFYKITHSVMCFIGWHRLIHWCQNSDNCPAEQIDKDSGFVYGVYCDYECWCNEVVGGVWTQDG